MKCITLMQIFSTGNSDQVKPILSEDDRVESKVTFETDEFGFPNPAPIPEIVDVAVLGRSFSLGAQSSQPWTRLLAEQTGLKILNLSQTGSGLNLKIKYLEDFGYLRHPRWVIMEVLPSMDIIGYTTGSDLLVPTLPEPIVRQLIRSSMKEYSSSSPVTAFYPLAVDIPGRTVNLTFYSYYLAALSIDENSLEASNQWNIFHDGLVEFISQAKQRSVCVLLMYVPTKPDIYFPLATNPKQLAPTLQGWSPWQLNSAGDLIQAAGEIQDVPSMQLNAPIGRDLMAEFAREQEVFFVDPTQAMMDAAQTGDTPFMVYDTHWSATGNQLVADLVAQKINSSNCP